MVSDFSSAKALPLLFRYVTLSDNRISWRRSIEPSFSYVASAEITKGVNEVGSLIHSVDIKLLRPPLLSFYTHTLSLDETGESLN